MVRLGIIGTGRIAGRFVTDAWQDLDTEIRAVYNPNRNSVESFCRRHCLPFGTGDWDEFLGQIDAAYVASPSFSHGNYIRMLLEGGKHVLCEKPMLLREQEAKELFAAAQSRNLVLMEAVKTAYCPGFKALLETLADGRIGEIRDVEACFTKLVQPGLRELTDRAYGGSMTELGTYGCFAVLRILGCDYANLRFSVQRNEQGMDIFTKVFFEYPDGRRTGLVKAGLGVKSEGELIVSGTRGYLLARAPWWMTGHFEVRYEDLNRLDVFDYPFAGNGLQYELRYFLERIQGKNHEKHGAAQNNTEQESIVLAGIMERFLAAETAYRE